MQFRLTLQVLDAEPVLPINYQYELSAWVYRVLENADAEYAAFLHQTGYQTGRKSFKLFCFSQLQVPRRVVLGDRLKILSPEIFLHIGFYLDRTAEEFVRGLFKEQAFTLGDRRSRVRFAVQSVEMRPLALPLGGAGVRIRTLSPLVIARKRPDGQQDEYLSPLDEQFGTLLYLNLLEKYSTVASVPSWWDTSQFYFQNLTQVPRSQLIKLKTGTRAETRVRGFRFEFELNCPHELVEMGLLAGFGRHSAAGFGFGEVF